MKRATAFEAGITAALANTSLQAALADVPAGFVAGRARVKAALPEFEVLRRIGQRGLERDLAKRRGVWPAGLDLDPPVVPHIEVDALLSPAVIAEEVLSTPLAEHQT